MEPWKERFVKEYWELDDRINKLNNMLDDWIRGVLKFEPKSSKELFLVQYNTMCAYRNILEERARIEGIPLFEKEEEDPAPPTLVTSQHFCYECKNFDGEKGKCHLPGTPDDPYFCGLANFWEVR